MISKNILNLNRYIDPQCLIDFRLRCVDIGKIVVLMGWKNRITAQYGYACDPITNYCTVLRKIDALARWRYFKAQFLLFQS